MPSIAIVGNGPVSKDQSGLIDACNVVVRFNEWKNYGQNSGLKADILCITNMGVPANRIIRGALIGKVPHLDQISEIWFPRDSEVHKAHTAEFAPEYLLNEFDDLSVSLLDSNNLSAKRIVRFSAGFNRKIFRTLLLLGHRSFHCPSTGIFAIEYILGEERFAGYQKFLFGFGFQGWRGHPWATERDLVIYRSLTRDDFHLGTQPRKPDDSRN